jgi:uncharacterized membrane protein YgdD (TMEM256/DUF423 family)
MNRNFIVIGALCCAVAVLCGAFGAHFLKTRLTAESLQTFETAVRYQFYHAFALIVSSLLYKEFPNKILKWSAYFFIAGIILFSGSLYILSCITPNTINWIGAITPFGGLCFITAWVFLAVGCIKKN